jgi:hypothetical protein
LDGIDAVNAGSDVTPMAPWLEQAWLDRYLDRQLGEPERAWFEAYALDQPHLLEAIEADTALRDLVTQEMVESLTVSTAPISEIAARPTSIRARREWWPLAACFVAGITLSWFGQGWLGSDSPEFPVVNPPRIVFDTWRGGEVGRHEEPGDPASPIVIVDIPIPPGAQIGALRFESGARVVALPVPKISADGFATLAVPSAWRGQGRLLVEVSSLDDGAVRTLNLPL